MSGLVKSGLRYFEFALDSIDAEISATQGVSSLNWPLFKIGGKRPLENIAAIKIIEAQIPFSWYVLDGRNNAFILTESGESAVGVLLTSGSYTITELLTEIADKLTAASTTAVPTITYTASFNSITQKITIQNNVASTIPFSLSFEPAADPGTTTPRLIMGFPGGPTQSQTFDVTNGDQMLAPSVAQVTGPNYLYVNSLKLGTMTNMYLPQGAVGGGNAGPQIAKIPIDVQPGGVIYWQDPDTFNYFDMDNLTALTEMDIYLTVGNKINQIPLDLNGASFSLKLAILQKEVTNDSSSLGLGGSRVNKRMRPA